jgi:hypothetical protein
MRAVLAALVLLIASGAGVQTRESAMITLARGFRDAEESLQSGDAAALAQHAELLRAAGQRLEGLVPQRNAELLPVFERCRSALAELAGKLGECARAQDLPHASQALEDLRSTCVQCHAKFREDNSERGLAPARRNTILGQVKVLKLDGSEREDASNVVVFLDGVPREGQRLPRSYRISQKDAQFEPRVLPVLAGSTVEFPNDDLVFHNVFSLSETQPFDLGAYGPGKSKSVEFTHGGLVRIYCNIHPQMVSTIVVLDDPCYALTDAKGLFVITDVPDGTWTLRTWHEFGGEHRESVTLTGAAVLERAITIQEDKNTVPHKNKFGKPYREAYK